LLANQDNFLKPVPKFAGKGERINNGRAQLLQVNTKQIAQLE
jgi:hypothetical protein